MGTSRYTSISIWTHSRTQKHVHAHLGAHEHNVHNYTTLALTKKSSIHILLQQRARTVFAVAEASVQDLHACVYMYIYIYILRVGGCRWVCPYICVCVRMYVGMYTYVFVCI